MVCQISGELGVSGSWQGCCELNILVSYGIISCLGLVPITSVFVTKIDISRVFVIKYILYAIFPVLISVLLNNTPFWLILFWSRIILSSNFNQCAIIHFYIQPVQFW